MCVVRCFARVSPFFLPSFCYFPWKEWCRSIRAQVTKKTEPPFLSKKGAKNDKELRITRHPVIKNPVNRHPLMALLLLVTRVACCCLKTKPPPRTTQNHRATQQETKKKGTLVAIRIHDIHTKTTTHTARQQVR